MTENHSPFRFAMRPTFPRPPPLQPGSVQSPSNSNVPARVSSAPPPSPPPVPTRSTTMPYQSSGGSGESHDIGLRFQSPPPPQPPPPLGTTTTTTTTQLPNKFPQFSAANPTPTFSTRPSPPSIKAATAPAAPLLWNQHRPNLPPPPGLRSGLAGPPPLRRQPPPPPPPVVPPRLNRGVVVGLPRQYAGQPPPPPPILPSGGSAPPTVPHNHGHYDPPPRIVAAGANPNQHTTNHQLYHSTPTTTVDPLMGNSSMRSQQSSTLPNQPPVANVTPPPVNLNNRPRIDPSQIPKPPSFTSSSLSSSLVATNHVPYLAKRHLGMAPPPAFVRYTTLDDGNATPNVVRCTVYSIPKDRSVWHSTGDIPLGLVCTPLALPSSNDGSIRMACTIPNPSSSSVVSDDGDTNSMVSYRESSTAIPVVESPPSRCSNCSAYAALGSPNCPLCMAKYPINSNLYRDGDTSLNVGTVEYQVDNTTYCTRSTPVQPVHLFALDLTNRFLYPVQAYMDIFKHVADQLRRQFDQQQQHYPTTTTTSNSTRGSCCTPQFGICLVSALGLMVRNKKDDRYLVMPDVTDDPYCPVPLHVWCYDIATESDALTTFLEEHLPKELSYWIQATTRFRTMDSRQDGLDVSCGGAALAFLADALATSGGRGTLITGRRPNYGVGKFTNPSSTGSPLQLWTEFNTKEEQCTSEFYKKLANRCCQNRVALSVVYQTNDSSITQSLDIATMGELCRATCGNLSWILKDEWQETLRNELLREALAFTGWDAVFKVRCSTGLTVKRFLGAKGKVIETITETELELSCVNHRTCICVELEHRVGGIAKENAVLQTALLYTNHLGQRRVRVSTLVLKVGLTAQDVFRSVDFSAQSSFLIRGVVDCVRQTGTDARQKGCEFLYHRTIQMLAGYRRCSSSPATQLVLPERMQLLPLFTMSLLKSPMLRANVKGLPISVTSDERAYLAWHANQSLPAYALLLAYPNVYRVDEDDSTTGLVWQEPTDDTNGCWLMPDAEIPSMESFDDNNGTYLLDDGLRIYLYFGPDVTDDVKASMTQHNSNLHRMVYQMRMYASTSQIDTRPTCAPLTLVRHTDVIYPLMVADASAGERDYMDFLITLHRRIRENAN